MYRVGRSVKAQIDRLSSGHSCTLFFILDIEQRCTVQRTILLLLGFLLYIFWLVESCGIVGCGLDHCMVMRGQRREKMWLIPGERKS
jgi:hypothetical protein